MKTGRIPWPAAMADTVNRATNAVVILRSEEHTSELQSRFDLVCRLLLEKKKKKTKDNLNLNQNNQHEILKSHHFPVLVNHVHKQYEYFRSYLHDYILHISALLRSQHLQT